MKGITEVIHAIDTATATTTSQAINIEGALAVSLVYKRSNHGTGSTTYVVDVSADKVNWIRYKRLILNTYNTNVQDVTRWEDIGISSNDTQFVSMDLYDALPFMRVTTTETTDGTHDVWVAIKR
jgi:hypothetical protein